ncbi:MAG: TetR family transcriptional regulator [Hydrogenophaga sp.]|jgi:TetR/AcrR family acrAB operon transcriptional repressor|uniref:TetR family transcriptional regulator n=1 Tax=Hydrogenophaga sp. TaxID=1904254 RepID=UPI00271761B6|nr:TetR family transcriptional regulator [Hydrogenophaga sp.]MDO9571109.1 TetR family transcriptional regulator [Hydrogenophaga sp.]MDP1894836.1 TetR family transcriptional regulator [Hydrogenophaga sp.]MDP2093469.1 TetR family transcriptional regulator [Hydrogenophaga sp.]MDP2220116.1 TetR family transcriptional regulator [Hydrogenophaga sp.]MDP3376595.1 TetR family transcriptional regulator [Hydrogenophaga sp.]
MVRRTKAEAEATRHSLLDAAEHLFQERGVSRTSLNDIATAAGTTRGAIYWHFKDKADLFNAMLERATLPLECGFPDQATPVEALEAPLEALRAGMRHVLHQIATDERVRRVFEVLTHQVEYNTEMAAVRERHLSMRQRYLALTEAILVEAAGRTGLRLPVPLSTASLGLHIVMDGLKHNWLLDPSAFDLKAVGEHTMNTYLRGLGFSLGGAPALRLQAPVHAMPT